MAKKIKMQTSGGEQVFCHIDVQAWFRGGTQISSIHGWVTKADGTTPVKADSITLKMEIDGEVKTHTENNVSFAGNLTKRGGDDAVDVKGTATFKNPDAELTETAHPQA